MSGAGEREVPRGPSRGARPRIAVVGAGLVGRRHADAVLASGAAELSCIVDPAPAGRAFAAGIGAPWRMALDELLEEDRPDGVILATPNAAHFDGAMACIAAGLPTLVEKPICDDLADARALVEAAEAASVPLLTGHHRRHNPLISAAKASLEAGEVGRILAVTAMFWLRKPDGYFETEWRRREGAGPVHLNLSHDIDLLRWLVGEVETVVAMEARIARGHGAEDTATALLRFANGALGTVTISDAIPAPWSWEMTSGENPAYPQTDQSCYLIGGERGALDLPRNRLWRHEGPEQSWWAPIAARVAPVPQADPLVRQAKHFAEVIRGDAVPLVSGREGLRTLEVVDAIKRAAGSGGAVQLG
ncbi:Gfo/Idh/MocA family protein [Rhodovulum sp. DZ06]|uniref:Gfo/Idh/MocA family protein n=1 Tax=Rhodovulum sp. DZ06 TaxID=3425126 RepID=UPI003D349F87